MKKRTPFVSLLAIVNESMSREMDAPCFFHFSQLREASNSLTAKHLFMAFRDRKTAEKRKKSNFRACCGWEQLTVEGN